MSYEVVSVTFDIDAQPSSDGRFSIPSEICKALGSLRTGDAVRLVIQTPGGAVLYSGMKQLSSGTEIYGADMAERIKAGQRIRVVASRS